MASILNASFEDWNFGTLISDPTDGQQLADNWYWNKGAVVPSVIIQRQTVPAPADGSFIMRVFAGSGGGGSNTTTFVYQDMSSHTDLWGKTIIVTVAVQTPSVSGVTGHIFVDDGVTVTSSSSNSADDTWHYLTVIKQINGAAPYVRIGLMPDNYGFTNVFFDIASFTIVHEISLTDSVLLTDDVRTEPTIIRLEDSIRMNEWFTIKKAPQPDPWT